MTESVWLQEARRHWRRSRFGGYVPSTRAHHEHLMWRYLFMDAGVQPNWINRPATLPWWL